MRLWFRKPIWQHVLLIPNLCLCRCSLTCRSFAPNMVAHGACSHLIGKTMIGETGSARS